MEARTIAIPGITVLQKCRTQDTAEVCTYSSVLSPSNVPKRDC